jgi:hypothetical protein
MFSGGKYGKWEVLQDFSIVGMKPCAGITSVSFPCDLLPSLRHRKFSVLKLKWKVNPGLPLMPFLSILYSLACGNWCLSSMQSALVDYFYQNANLTTKWLNS